MTRKELIRRVHEGISGELSERQIASVIDRAFEEIAASIRSDGRYVHPGFGTFTVRVHGARVGRNPRTGEAIDIAEGATVAFKPSAELKASLDR